MDETKKPEIDASIVTAPPLQNWKNPPSLTDLKKDLQDAIPIHNTQTQKIRTWLDNLNVEGAAKVKASEGNSSIVPKLIRKQAEWRYAPLSEPFLSTEDLFNVKPKSWEDREAARQNELLLNHQFNTQIDKIRFIDEYVRAAVDEGTVIVRVGWEFREEEYEAEEPNVIFRVNPQLSPLHEELARLKVESPSQYMTEVPQELKDAHDMTIERGEPIEPVLTGETTIVKKTRVVSNKPTVEVCDYRNVVIDPTAMGNIKKANFVIYSWETSLSELKKDGRYKNLDRILVSQNSPLAVPDHAVNAEVQSFNFQDEPRKKFVVYEYWGYWDIDGSGMTKPIVAAWVGDTMIRLEENPYPDKCIPFVVAQYLPVRRSNYGEPDGALLEDNQKVVGAITRGMIDLLGKSANGQTGIRKDALDATNKRKFDKGQDYEFNVNVDPNTAIHHHTYPEIPASAQFMLQMQHAEAESITGVKSFHQGVSGQSLGDVAAGVRGALDAASKRELSILRRLAAGIVEIGRKIIAMNAEFLSEEEIVRLTNEEFVTVKRDDLAGNFDLHLSISTAEEDNNKAEQLAFVLQTMGPNGDPELGKMVLSDICRLRKMPDLAKKIEAYQPQPDPLVVREQELKIALLEAQIAKVQSETIGNEAKAQLDSAKVGTEEAKARQLSSEADLNDLDFVEQESGVKQEREIQKAGEQARSQAQLKILDHQFRKEEKKMELVKEYLAKRGKS